MESINVVLVIVSLVCACVWADGGDRLHARGLPRSRRPCSSGDRLRRKQILGLQFLQEEVPLFAVIDMGDVAKSSGRQK